MAPPAKLFRGIRKKPLVGGLMGEVAGKAREGPPVPRRIGGQGGHGAPCRLAAVMGMGTRVASDTETVSPANELLRCRSRVGVVAGGALPAPYRPVDAPPHGIRVVARQAPLGVLLELGERGTVRIVARRAFAFGDGLVKVPRFPFRCLFKIVVAGVACLLLVLLLQFPVLEEVASIASVVQGRVETDRPENQRRIPFPSGKGEPVGGGTRKKIYPCGSWAGLDAVDPGRQANVAPLERFSLERTHRLPVDGYGERRVFPLLKCEHLDARLGR